MTGQLILDPDPEQVEQFRVMIDARSRHADLWPLVLQLGSQKALAERVGINQSTIGAWINLRAFPNRVAPTHVSAVEAISVINGKSFDEMWPPALRSAIGMGKAEVRRAVEITTGTLQLASNAADRLMLPAPDEVAEQNEVSEIIKSALRFLTSREKAVVKMRTFEGKTLLETAKELRVTIERVRQIELRAMRKLKKVMSSQHKQIFESLGYEFD